MKFCIVCTCFSMFLLFYNLRRFKELLFNPTIPLFLICICLEMQYFTLNLYFWKKLMISNEKIRLITMRAHGIIVYFHEQIPELDFEIPAEAQRGTLSIVAPKSPTPYCLSVLKFLFSGLLLSLVCCWDMKPDA